MPEKRVTLANIWFYHQRKKSKMSQNKLCQEVKLRKWKKLYEKKFDKLVTDIFMWYSGLVCRKHNKQTHLLLLKCTYDHKDILVQSNPQF